MKSVWAFLLLSALLVVSQIVSQEAISALETVVVATRVPMALAAIISAVLFIIVIWAGYHAARSHPRPGPRQQWWIAAITFLTLVLSNAMPTWGFDSLGIAHWPTDRRIAMAVLLAIVWLALCHFLLPGVLRWFQTPIDLAADKSLIPPPGPVSLIALVSRVDLRALTLLHDTATLDLTQKPGDNAKIYTMGFQSLAEDIENLHGSKWPWQQLLRAIGPYAPRTGLKVILVGSRTCGPDEMGSHEQINRLVDFLGRYPELREAAIEIFPRALDFEHFNEVKDAIRLCIQSECQRDGVREGNVFVDITGGQKIASAAAAAATIGGMGQFQYVRTNIPEAKTADRWHVIVSDLHPQAVPSAGN